MMSNSRIPSPARSLGVSSPRRYIQRRSRSVCSPGRAASVKLTAMLTDFVPSPLPNRRSVLNDDTEIIDMPKRQSWWRKLDENSRDVMELFEHKDVPETNNIEENFDVEILSQENKNYTLDLPESSDGESISSIVIPQRKLFTQKENHPPKKFPRVFNNREELVKLQKSHVDHDKEIDVRPKNLFNQAKKPKTKPIFPSALLNISTNKSIANKTREMPNVEPKGQVRTLFGNRPGTKRKNMFADFVVSESEDEVPEIQAKVFGFQKKPEQKRRVSNAIENSPTASILDVDIDDWKQLPSSTMMENQIEDLAATPSKRQRLSRFIEPQETASPNKSLNKTKHNESVRSRKSKRISSRQNIEEDVEINTTVTQKPNQSKTLNKTRTEAQISKLGKAHDAITNKPEEVQNITFTGKNNTLNNKKVSGHTNINAAKTPEVHEENKEPIEDGSDGENDFTLEYENDEDNLELVEKEVEKNVSKQSSEENFQKLNKTSVHNLSSQAKVQEDIDKSENKANTTLVKSSNMNVSENPKSNRDNSRNYSVNKHSNKTRESIVQNKSIVTTANREIVSDKHINSDKNKTMNSEDLVNKMTEDNSKHLDKANENKEKSNAKVNNSISEVNIISPNLEQSETREEVSEAHKEVSEAHKEVSEASIRTDVDDDDIQDQENENSSEESIQLDEIETHNESKESEYAEENEDNESSNEVNETEQNTNEEETSSNLKEMEEMVDEVDNICENNSNLNKSVKKTEKSKNNETKIDPPETILFQQSKNFIESFSGKDDGKSPRKTKSMLKTNLRPSLAPVRESTGFSDNTANSSGANSGWDSHRTTRKTLRKTFGKDFTPRKSLRTLVMEKSAKQRQTFNPDLHDISKHPRANSTELPGHGMNEPQEQFDDETIENIQQAIENNVIVKETPEGTANDIVDDDCHTGTEEVHNKTQERSTAPGGQTQEDSDNENYENSDDENDNSDVEASVHENDASENQQIEESDANDTSNNEQIDEESDHANNTSNNQEIEDEIDHENVSNNEIENESDHANDTSNNEIEEESDHANHTSNQQTDEENDQGNDTSNNQMEEESDHTNNTSHQQTDQESDHDVSMNEDTNQEEESDQENSDNDTRDNQVEESYHEVTDNVQENTEMEQTAEETNHFSKSMKQRTLEMYLEKINKQELERGKRLRENLMNSLKTKDTHNFKVPAIPMRRNIKPVPKKVKAPTKVKEVDDLPEEVKQDLKYKPPRRYQPKNASWATMRLYKYLESKLEPKYDYMARVRAEKLVDTLHEFTRHVRRHDAAPAHMVAALKQEMARLRVVYTHYEFYHFFHEFMPREIRVKVNPDIVNRIQLPKDVFSNIIRS